MKHLVVLRLAVVAAIVVGLVGGLYGLVWSDPATAEGRPPGEGNLSCELDDGDEDGQHWRCSVMVMSGICQWVEYDTGEVVMSQDADGVACTDYETDKNVLCQIGDDDNDIPSGEIRCPLEAEWTSRPGSPAAAGYQVIQCRNERELMFDTHRMARVPANAPQWWLDEIENESNDHRSGFEGRGETDETDDRTKNLGAQGCKLAATWPDTRSCDHIDGQLPGPIIPDDCWGTYPSDRYEVTWDAGSITSFDGWGDRFTGWVSMLLFALSKLAIRTTLWLVGFAFAFDIGEYKDDVAAYAASIDQELVHIAGHDLNLIMVAWFALFAGAGFWAVRGKLGRATAEILMSILLAAVSWVVLGPMFEPLAGDGSSAPAYAADGYMDSLANLIDRSSVAPILAGHGLSPNQELNSDELHELLRDTQGILHEEFVEAPYYYINWGKGPDDFDTEVAEGAEQSCDQIQENLLSITNKPRGWPSRYMARHGCLEDAEYNSAMNPTRFAAVVLVLLVAMFVAFAVGLAAFTLLLAKFLVAGLFVALPVAAAAALLPGRGRRMAWWWLGSVLQLWLASLAMGVVVMLLLFALDILQTTTSGLSLTERWVTLLSTVVVIYLARKRMVAGTQRLARVVSVSLGSVTQTPGQVWRTPWRTGPAFAGAHGAAGEAAGHRGESDLEPATGGGGSGGMMHWAGGGDAGSGGSGPAGQGHGPSPSGPAGVEEPVSVGGGGGELDLLSVDRGAARAGSMAKTGAVVAGVAGIWAGSKAARLAGSVTRATWRLGRQHRMENRKQVKFAALRASLNEVEELTDQNHGLAAKGKQLYLPDENGVVTVRDDSGQVVREINTGTLAGQVGGNITLEQALHGTWRFRMGAGQRAVRRGRLGLYGGGPVGHIRYSRLGYKPQAVRTADAYGPDGQVEGDKWQTVRPAPFRKVPREAVKQGQEKNEKIIERMRRNTPTDGLP